ncbi:MAG: CDGSH iron-sulfur domain-containing protein [Bacteroidales bacterium]|nr:CDGSH iron-sulfur domain-containing protein [Bacteroidales bacterium]MCF8389237.1 CDGSH iron-sulfur domain-containing protein [Bacteroidales bacterium]
MKNGPILVEGDFLVNYSTGEEIKATKMTSFCRCGHSHAQPFCDGTHRKVGFVDE